MADNLVFERIFKLVNEEHQNLDEALFEFTHSRQDLHALLNSHSKTWQVPKAGGQPPQPLAIGNLPYPSTQR